MSSSCPVCKAQLPQDFGLVSCSSCGTVVSVDIDGNAQVATDQNEVVASDSLAPEEIQIDDKPQEFGLLDEAAQSEQAKVSEQSEHRTEELLNATESPEFFGDILHPSEKSDGEMLEVEDSPLNLESPLESESEAHRDPSPMSFQEELLEFANQEHSSGPLSYILVISGLDHKEVLTKVQEALSDPQFGWSPAEKMKELKRGEMILKNLNPAQAVVLVRRLSVLNVKLSWRQNAFDVGSQDQSSQDQTVAVHSSGPSAFDVKGSSE